jgi:hypothetical protein
MILTTSRIDDTVSLPLFVSHQVLAADPICEALPGIAGFTVGFLSEILLCALFLYRFSYPFFMGPIPVWCIQFGCVVLADVGDV